MVVVGWVASTIDIRSNGTEAVHIGRTVCIEGSYTIAAYLILLRCSVRIYQQRCGVNNTVPGRMLLKKDPYDRWEWCQSRSATTFSGALFHHRHEASLLLRGQL